MLDPGADAALRDRQRRVLWMVLAVNASMFAIEMVASWYAGSTALLADALDFFADSATYAITLYVLAKSAQWKAGAALIKGLAMGAFGLWVIAVVLYRLTDPAVPDASMMGGIGLLALAANAGSALLLYWHRGDDLNMRSVWLCSRNDAIANIAVIIAAGAVAAVPEDREQVIDFLGHSLLSRPGGFEADPKVVGDGELGEDLPPLRHQRDAVAGATVGGQGGDIPVVEVDRAAVGPQDPHDHLQQCGLADPVAADHAGDPPRGHGRGDPVQGLDGPVGEAKF